MKFLLFSLISFISFIPVAQTLDSTEINGTKYYIYPFAQEATPCSLLARVLSNNEDFKAQLALRNPTLTNKEIKQLIKEYKKLGNYSEVENRVKVAKSIEKIVKANASKFYQTNYTLNNDIIPALDRLPAGKYIQYFSNYYLFDTKQQAVLQEKQIAGIFELKNNVLDGEAIWFNVLGDTVKKGKFENGLKVGEWKLASYLHGSYRLKFDVQFFLKYPIDFDIEYSTFQHGILNGPTQMYSYGNLLYTGFYKDGKECGEWIYYTQKTPNEYDTVSQTIVKKRFTYASKRIVSHKVFIRNTQYNYEQIPYKYFTFPTMYETPDVAFNTLRENNIAKNELDLPEEDLNGYEGEVYYDDYYPGRKFSGDNGLINPDVEEEYFFVNGDYISKKKFLDSIGYINLYEGVYEEFYDNGQLKIRLNFSNGELQEEDTIFWDNGKPADVIVYNSAQKSYENRFYDYAGTVYKINVYDSIGNFKAQTLDPFYKDKHILIEGLNTSIVEDYKELVEVNEMVTWNHFTYDNSECLLDKNLSGTHLITKNWYSDTSNWFIQQYNADEKKLTEETFSLNGNKFSVTESEFSNSFESVRGKKNYYFNNLHLERTFNGSRIDFFTFDSLKIYFIFNIENSYMLTYDDVLYQDNELYNGKVKIRFDARKPKFKLDKKALIANLDWTPKDGKFIRNAYDNWKSTGNQKWKDILSLSSSIDLEYIQNYLSLFPQIYEAFELESAEATNSIYTIDGRFSQGKPTGIWRSYSQNGDLLKEVNLLNGELNGPTKTYDFALPKSKKKESLYDVQFSFEAQNFDSIPAKKIHYLAKETHYKNGLRWGVEKTYNWMGKLTSSCKYEDGFPIGPAFESNAIATTYTNYEDGALDGLVKTYLHLPHKDTILLHELNFQNGYLQGESKSYHTNGKLAKRGFFLDGMPIDDYEAFDTLGTKFHYIKFQYSYPIEEKIWESNQLSVKYDYDWRDSIYFMPEDLTVSTSVNNLLYQFGMLGSEYNQPYYGRPSLIEKTGIDYHMTKYFPNDTISREGEISSGKKVGCWNYFNYDGVKIYEIEYHDSVLKINDSIQFNSKGIYTDYDAKGNPLSKSFVIEKFEKYDCSHTDHYEVRQFYTFWQAHDSLHRINGYVRNHYDNGTIQSEGRMENGLPTGIWKYYDPFGKLNHVGEYKQGKRDGRWLSGDLSKTKYLGDICMNPNLPDIEEQIKYQEKILDLFIRYFKLGKLLNSESYGVNLNDFDTSEDILPTTEDEE